MISSAVASRCRNDELVVASQTLHGFLCLSWDASDRHVIDSFLFEYNCPQHSGRVQSRLNCLVEGEARTPLRQRLPIAENLGFFLAPGKWMF